MTDSTMPPLTAEELAAESGTALPDKEVISLLDLNADLNIGLDAAAPIDLAVAANANVAAPIEAAVGANVLSVGSDAQALAAQGAHIDQGITGEAIAHGAQGSTIDQAHSDPAPVAPATQDPTPGAAPDPTAGAATGEVPDAVTSGSPLDGPLLNVDVNLAADLHLAAPIAGAVAANANVAAPIDASVAGNIGSIDSHAAALAQQDAVITQHVDADAHATTDQSSDISQ
ncbi:peptidoglycan-binding protein [Pedococcus sp. KACC 23699]|uniref:Peptidoglycan-binding protein n=1 Tax=Pedococcus sp. KACC 23699 TaxID=3149228 RepID=A0AAU7JQF3_9MICO